MSESPLHVLLVEDNPGDVRLIREMLREATRAVFHLHTADRLAAGLAYLAQGGADVVLLDLSLPDSSGYDTFARLYAATEHVPIVVLTGLDDASVAMACVRAGAQDYLMKGQVDTNLLVRAMRYAIERMRSEDELRRYREQLEALVAERTLELRRAQEQLLRRERLAMLGQLAGGVGHELRNPLGVIKNATYLLGMLARDPDPDVREALAIIGREVGAADRIINSLLDYARVRSPRAREVDVGGLVRQAIAHAAVPDNVSVICRSAEALPPVRADPDQLGQVFNNLVANAIQAMPDGGRLTVELGVADAGPVGAPGDNPGRREVRIGISDTGVGIGPESLGRIFEPLFTTKAKGIGLGLSLVKLLVEGHGGCVDVSSVAGQGSTFTVRLPLSGPPGRKDSAVPDEPNGLNGPHATHDVSGLDGTNPPREQA